jgi:hypothetical protein
VLNHIRVERAEPRVRKTSFDLGMTTSADVDDGKRQCFVERGVGVRDPDDSSAIAQRSIEGTSEDDRHILGRVVGIDRQIAVRPHGHVKNPVPCERIPKMIDKPDPGPDVRVSGTVDDYVDRNPGFSRLPLEVSASRLGYGAI